MSEPRQSVQEYIRAAETLSKIDDLSEAEIHAIAQVLMHLSEKLLNSRDHGTV
jgi:hypothetical protein